MTIISPSPPLLPPHPQTLTSTYPPLPHFPLSHLLPLESLRHQVPISLTVTFAPSLCHYLPLSHRPPTFYRHPSPSDALISPYITSSSMTPPRINHKFLCAAHFCIVAPSFATASVVLISCTYHLCIHLLQWLSTGTAWVTKTKSVFFFLNNIMLISMIY